MPEGQAAAGLDEAGVAGGDGQRHPGRHGRPAAAGRQQRRRSGPPGRRRRRRSGRSRAGAGPGRAGRPAPAPSAPPPGPLAGSAVASGRRRSLPASAGSSRVLDAGRRLLRPPAAPTDGLGRLGRVAYHPVTSAIVLVWMDLEMTGLDLDRHVIVEVATLVTDDDLRIVAEGPDLVVATDRGRPGADGRLRPGHAHQERAAGRDRRLDGVPGGGRSGHPGLHPEPTSPRPGRCRWPATRSAPTAGSWPPSCPRSRSTSTTGRSTSPPSRSWPGAGTRTTVAGAPTKAGGHRAMDDIRESVAELAYYRSTVFRERAGAGRRRRAGSDVRRQGRPMSEPAARRRGRGAAHPGGGHRHPDRPGPAPSRWRS